MCMNFEMFFFKFSFTSNFFHNYKISYGNLKRPNIILYLLTNTKFECKQIPITKGYLSRSFPALISNKEINVIDQGVSKYVFVEIIH